MNRGAVAEIDLNAISSNLRAVRDLSNNRPVIAIVKADAYGHGAVEVSKRLVEDGVEYLAVAFTEESKEIRDANINVPILVLFDADIKDIFQYNLIPVISDIKTAIAVSKEAEKNNKNINVHIKIDTGMGRLGFIDGAVKEILKIASLKGINIDGIMSHFSEADLLDASFAHLQIDRFNSIKAQLSENGLSVRLFHIANSAAVQTIPESHFDAVRPGLMLYGYSPVKRQGAIGTRQKANNERQEMGEDFYLSPVMSVKTKILALRRLPAGTPIGYGRTFITKRESLIGVIPVGYADGFSRQFSNNADVLVRGKRVPVVGRVCMDLTMIDLTDAGQTEEGDEVIIIGKQGDETIDAHELAFKAGTIPYEILTSLGSKAKKVYIR